jgi:5-hydroxyisourate hydrolase
MSAITTHVLNTALGRPAAGVTVRIEVLDERGQWHELAEGATDANGRIAGLLDAKLERREYRLIFETAGYFQRLGQPVFYPRIEIAFRVEAPGEHYHIPLLLSPYGYSTYRGS